MVDLNKYIIKASCIEMIINSKTHGLHKVLLSHNDYDIVKNYKWSLTPRYNKSKGKYFYVQNAKKGTLHRFLCPPETGMVVDHINGNTLDNRRENLRVITYGQNGINRAGYGKINIKFLSYRSKRPGHNAAYTVKFPNLKCRTFVDLNEARAYYLECLFVYERDLKDVCRL